MNAAPVDLKGFPRVIAVLLSGCIAALGMVGCGSGNIVPPPDPTPAVDRLYETYLDGSVDQARNALQEAAKLIDQIPSAHGRARGLYLVYARLYALELRENQPDLAELYLVKAKYWFIRGSEIGNRSEEEVSAALKALTTNACIEFVDDWDKRHSNGRGANYLKKR